MELLYLIIKILLILAAVGCMAAPFFINRAVNGRARDNEISHKHLRILVFSVVYAIAITTVLCVFKDIYLWFASIEWLQKLASLISISDRVKYIVSILTTVIINTAIGAIYLFLQQFVRIGLKKKSLVIPKKKNGEYSLGQRIERAVVRFFHTETWFFVAATLRWFNILISVAYAGLFIAFFIPALSGAEWIPYDLLQLVYKAGYIYPTITLLVLWDIYWLLEGIRMVDTECPELLYEKPAQASEETVDLNKVNDECKKFYADRHSAQLTPAVRGDFRDGDADTGGISALIGKAVERDERNAHEARSLFMKCIDELANDRNIVVEGGFFSQFGLYLVRYLSIILARGENVVFVCNSDDEIDAAYEYLKEGLSSISSLYCNGFGEGSRNYDSPIWGIMRVHSDGAGTEKSAIDEHSVLITSVDYLCSSDFESNHAEFIQRINTVVYINTVQTLTLHASLMSLMNSRYQNIARVNAQKAKSPKHNDGFKARYIYRPIRYICFDDTQVPGLDKVLENLLSVDFETSDCMRIAPDTLISCYNYEGVKDENGNSHTAQFINSDEELGLFVNMIALCRAKGIPCVSLFTNDSVPYDNMIESAMSNSSKFPFSMSKEHIRINRYYYDPDAYSAIIAVDALNNLPHAVRAYARLAGDTPTLINIISRPYMLRDYYAANLAALWEKSQVMRIPVRDGVGRDIALKILVKSNAGGISEDELFNIAANDPALEKEVKSRDANGIMLSILKYFGITATENRVFYQYFEYVTERDFDENGDYALRNHIHLRKKGKLYEMLEGRDLIRLRVNDSVTYTMPVSGAYLSQRFIPEQNLLYNGTVYYIKSIDPVKRIISAKLATGGYNNDPYEYIQTRRYNIEATADKSTPITPVKHVTLGRSEGSARVNDVFISAFRAPMEVLTTGYYVVDVHNMDNNPKTNGYVNLDRDYILQTYRKYGSLTAPTFDADRTAAAGSMVSGRGAAVMSIRITGSFGPDSDKVSALAAVMLTEVLRSVFPFVCHSVAVAPVLKDPALYENCGCGDVGKLYASASLTRDGAPAEEGDSMELLIIEDCEQDLGVISTYISASDNLLLQLFEPLLDYLNWSSEYKAESDIVKNSYLHFGRDAVPACFDMQGLHDLVRIIGDDKHQLKYTELEPMVEYVVCDFCGKRFVKGDSVLRLDDGRVICNGCADTIVGNDKKALRAYLANARLFMENTYGIALDGDVDFCFESTVKIANMIKAGRKLLNRGADVPLRGFVDTEKRKAYAEYDVPPVALAEILVRKLTSIWQYKNLPDLAEELAEGQIALVAVQYLRFLQQDALANVRTSYYESNSLISGEGYRKLVKALAENPQFDNNSFRYLLEMSGLGSAVIEQPPKKITNFGVGYTPKAPDRTPGEKPDMYCYSQLGDEEKAVYDTMLAAIEAHEGQCSVDTEDTDVIFRASRAITNDRPDLFYYITCTVTGNVVELKYGATAEQTDALRVKIEEALPQFTAGVEDSMSAYDIALRLYANIMGIIDYDTLALNEEKANGRDEDRIDNLRTVCGVFLDKKAVCAGYARALQYLLQMYGIECAYAAGEAVKTDPEDAAGRHAWNLVKLDGDYYYMDVTWDDNSDTVQSVRSTYTDLDYFCVTTEEILRTRRIDTFPVEMPLCTATKCNYFCVNDAVLDSYDLGRIKSIGARAAKSGANEFAFKFKSAAVYEEAFSRLFRDSSDWCEVMSAAAKADKKIDSSTLTYRYNKHLRTITIYFKYK